MTHYTRSQWGARAPRAGNPTTPGRLGVAVHYNGPAMKINAGRPCDCAARVRQIQAFHMDGRGWADIAYDVVACPHGNTFQGRLGTSNGTGANGSSSANRDFKAVMALIGEGEAPGDALKLAILDGIRMCRAFGAGPRITGHRDHQSTACPGSALYAWVKAGAPAPSTTPEAPVTALTLFLQRGDLGAQVSHLQKVLNAVNNAGLETDGSFGPAVESAVRAFQSSRRLQVDGKVGPATRAALNAEWDAKQAPDPAPKPPTPPPAPNDKAKVLLEEIRDRLEQLEALL